MNLPLEGNQVLSEPLLIVPIVLKDGAVSFVSAVTWKEVARTLPPLVENFGREPSGEPFNKFQLRVSPADLVSILERGGCPMDDYPVELEGGHYRAPYNPHLGN